MNEKTKFEETIGQIVSELNKSPTFAMSLGAKELFHTNFLAFLLETDLAPIGGITKALKRKLLGAGFEGDVWALRESKNMDLIVVPQDPCSVTDCSIVVIEAKLKSIPTISQLNAYESKISGDSEGKDKKNHRFGIGEVDALKYDYVRLSGGNTVEYRCFSSERKKRQSHKWDAGTPKEVRRILLAPTDPYRHTPKEVGSPRWEYWSWKEVHSLLVKELDGIKRDEGGIVSLVEAYAGDLDRILNLLEQTNKLVDDFCAGKLRIDFQCFDKLLLEPFKKARIHDLISKYAYWHLSENLQEKLGEVGFQLAFDVHFSRGMPILEISKQLGEHEIGVQIQGGQYRHFILSRKPDDGLEFFSAKRLRWFSWSESEIESAAELNKFDDKKFLYSKKDMRGFNFDSLGEELIDSFNRCPTE